MKDISEDVKQIIFNHYSEILSELEDFIDTDDIDLSINISSERYGFEGGIN